MDRKEFLSRSLQLGLGCCALNALLAPSPLAAEEESKQGEAAKKQAAFVYGWVVSMMEAMDGSLDHETRVAMMKSCGKACATNHAAEILETYRGNLDGLVEMLHKEFGDQGMERADNRITMTWDRCLCPVVMGGEAKLSDTFCHCSQGWFTHVFETATGKPVQVDLLEAIKRGDLRCRVRVTV